MRLNEGSVYREVGGAVGANEGASSGRECIVISGPEGTRRGNLMARPWRREQVMDWYLQAERHSHGQADSKQSSGGKAR